MYVSLNFIQTASVTGKPYAGDKGCLIMKYKRSANEGRDYLTNILEITILIAKHNAGKIKVTISNFILTNDKVCKEISYLLLPKLSFIKIDIYLFLCLFVFCFLKRHDEAHNTIHTNLHDVDLLDMACQQELEEREQLLPDKNNSTELAS